MPAFLTHSLFAKDVLDNLKSLKEEKLKEEINSRIPLYFLGAQGPDIFFYYHVKPWLKSNGLQKVGFLMHDNLTGDFFTEAFKYTRDNFEKYGFDSSQAYDIGTYIAGYLCHFALDYVTHPFIHYTAGIDTMQDNSTHKYHNYHKRLESIIDVIMLKRKYNKEAYHFKSFELIKGIDSYAEVLSDFYINILETVYGYSISKKQVYEAIHDIRETLSLIYDPSGVKALFYKLFEIINGKKDEVTSAIHPHRIDGRIDYLNLSHRLWTHPCINGMKSNKSFLDLYEEAQIEAQNLIYMMLLFLHREINEEQVRDKISNTSYTTGSLCGSSANLKFFDSIFENPRVV